MSAGFAFRRSTGRCANGFERDGGQLTHAVPILVSGNADWFGRSVCGQTPGDKSNGWSEHKEKELTCKRCAARIAKAEGGE